MVAPKFRNFHGASVLFPFLHSEQPHSYFHAWTLPNICPMSRHRAAVRTFELRESSIRLCPHTSRSLRSARSSSLSKCRNEVRPSPDLFRGPPCLSPRSHPNFFDVYCPLLASLLHRLFICNLPNLWTLPSESHSVLSLHLAQFAHHTLVLHQRSSPSLRI